MVIGDGLQKSMTTSGPAVYQAFLFAQHQTNKKASRWQRSGEPSAELGLTPDIQAAGRGVTGKADWSIIRQMSRWRRDAGERGLEVPWPKVGQMGQGGEYLQRGGRAQFP